MPLAIEVGLSPGHIVLDGNPAPLPRKGAQPPIFSPCLLWPNGCMDQDATWYSGRPRPRPHCARWRPSSPPEKRRHSPFPQFSAYVCCGQTAEWIKMPLGTMVGLGQGNIVLDAELRTQLHPPRGIAPTPKFWLMSVVSKRLDGSRCHFVRR